MSLLSLERRMSFKDFATSKGKWERISSVTSLMQTYLLCSWQGPELAQPCANTDMT